MKTKKDFKKTQEQYRKVLPVLKEKWPTIFNHYKRKPLAHRISNALIKATEFSAEEIQSFLAIWCSDYHYQTSLMYSLYRVSLDGEPTALVTWEERAKACERYHNFLMKRNNQEEKIRPTCQVFTKANMAREMYNHFCAHRTGCESAGVPPETAEHFFDVDEINFLVAQYRGDRSEAEFELITTAYLNVNKDGETIKRESFETKSE